MPGLDEIQAQVGQALNGLLEVARLKPGQILVVGCSTSEVLGKRIGSAGNTDVAKAILEVLMRAAREKGFFLAIQCCEHLNRALVVEEECAEKYNLEPVTVYPVPKAGGATAGMAMQMFQHPTVVESIRAHAGMDIGDTFIGMHLRPVAVPVRLPIKSIGYAHLTMARTRPKLIGGQRAVYKKDDIEDKFGKGV
ncbi:MAG TPA: TIGR01440 family protein [Firmicutes bacterium]|nr:TIGR01440 family protein [Bacillota bacterium]